MMPTVANLALRKAMKKPAKYRAAPTIVDGVRFASKREAARFGELKLLERAGEIKELDCHPAFPLLAHSCHIDGFVEIGRYTADFRYFDNRSGQYVVEDVKSPASKTQSYELRRKIFEANYPLKITEVA